MDTLKIARDLTEGDVFSHEQAERLANAFATYWAEIRSELVTKDYLDSRLKELEAKIDAKIGQLDSKIDAKIGHLDNKIDTRVTQLEARIDIKLAQMQNKILASQVALFVLLGIAIYFK
jgi:outer membrane PBP1 activator LpoA protein